MAGVLSKMVEVVDIAVATEQVSEAPRNLLWPLAPFACTNALILCP